MPSLHVHAGGDDGLRRLTEVLYASVLADPLLQPRFGTRVATRNSHAVTDSDLDPCDEVPRWTGPGDEVPAP